MSLHNLTPAEGSVKKGKRIARGEGSGKGGTATRGHNGQNLVLVILKRLVLKVGKCHFKDVYQSLVLQTSIE